MIRLRVRTEFSFKEAFGPINRVAAAVAETGAAAAGIVDPGTFGHVRWSKALAAVGVKPLFGAALPVPTSDGLRRPLAWALAAETRAFYRLSTAARKPGADVAALFRDAGPGAIRFAGAALTDPSTFDYVDCNPGSPLAIAAALRLAEKTKKPLVVTSDNYYPRAADRSPFLAMGGRERSTPQHILTYEELRGELRMLTTKQWDAAVANGVEIAERCASALPTAPLIEVEGDLRKVVEAGRRRRLKLGHIAKWTPEYAARLKREIRSIEEKNYASYFLVVADLVNWAKKRMLVGPGRGSSAGSLLCYLVGITEVDPIPNDLLFERFIDINRGGWKFEKELEDYGPFPPSLEAEENKQETDG